MEYQQLLVEHLGLVDKVVRFVARRHHLSAADAEEFASLVRFKLVDRNFAILRKFEGRSSMSTYLTIVIDRLCLDFCIAKWGKWRPSTAARRLGAVAVLLERLIVREGMTFDEAVGTLQTNHGLRQTREDLHTLLRQLPRTGRVVAQASPDVVSDELSSVPFDRHDDERLVERVHRALARAFQRLPEADQQLVSLRFAQGLSVAQIARVLVVDPKPLYRRLGQIIAALEDELRRRGIEETAIERIVGHPTLMLPGVIGAPKGRNAG